MVCQHLAKFGYQKYSSSGDMFLVSHVIKQEQAIKGKSGYKDRSS